MLNKQPPFIYHISNVFPLSSHPHYNADLECSDKLILPASFFQVIRRAHLPLPPIFALKHCRIPKPPVLCGVFEFTAEENYLYCPEWVLKKVYKKYKYNSHDISIEILHTKKRNTHVFPMLKKVEVLFDEVVTAEQCRSGLMMYTMVSKGERIKVRLGPGRWAEGVLTGVLPRNRCLIKGENFEVAVVEKTVESFETEDDYNQTGPLIESLPISLLVKQRKVEKRKFEAYTPWEHRIQPIHIEGESIDLLPWDKEDVDKHEITTQTLPEIMIYTPSIKAPEKFKQRKLLTLAFPQISLPERRPLTTLEVDIKYKTISNSPNTLRSHHKNSVY